MKRLLLTFSLLVVLTACGAQTQPPAPTEDLEATVAAMAGTMIAGTLTAQPTETPLPSATPLPPTETPIPPTETPTETPEPTITATLIPFYGEFAPGGLPSGIDRGYALFQNETKIGPVHLNLEGTTLQGLRLVYYKYTFEERQHRYNIPLGEYKYIIYLGDKKMFSGTIRITGPDKTTFFIREDKVVIVGP